MRTLCCTRPLLAGAVVGGAPNRWRSVSAASRSSRCGAAAAAGTPAGAPADWGLGTLLDFVGGVGLGGGPWGVRLGGDAAKKLLTAVSTQPSAMRSSRLSSASGGDVPTMPPG